MDDRQYVDIIEEKRLQVIKFCYSKQFKTGIVVIVTLAAYTAFIIFDIMFAWLWLVFAALALLLFACTSILISFFKSAPAKIVNEYYEDHCWHLHDGGHLHQHHHDHTNQPNVDGHEA